MGSGHRVDVDEQLGRALAIEPTYAMRLEDRKLVTLPGTGRLAIRLEPLRWKATSTSGLGGAAAMQSDGDVDFVADLYVNCAANSDEGATASHDVSSLERASDGCMFCHGVPVADSFPMYRFRAHVVAMS